MSWSELHLVILSARYIPGKNNVLADQLNYPDEVLPMEWSLLPQVFNAICEEFGHPRVDLFDLLANMKLPLYVSLVPDPKV